MAPTPSRNIFIRSYLKGIGYNRCWMSVFDIQSSFSPPSHLHLSLLEVTSNAIYTNPYIWSGNELPGSDHLCRGDNNLYSAPVKAKASISALLSLSSIFIPFYLRTEINNIKAGSDGYVSKFNSQLLANYPRALREYSIWIVRLGLRGAFLLLNKSSSELYLEEELWDEKKIKEPRPDQKDKSRPNEQLWNTTKTIVDIIYFRA